MADIQGTLSGDLPDPTASGADTATGGGSLGRDLRDPTGGLDAVPAGPTVPDGPRNLTVDTATGPAVAMEVDLAVVKKVIRGYEDEITRLDDAKIQLEVVARVQNPGEDESSYTYKAGHDGTSASLRQAWQALIDRLTERRNMLDAVVRQYEGTEASNANDLREQ